MTSIKQKGKENVSLRKCNKGRKLRQWNPQNMAKAIAAVRNKEMGWLKASIEMDVPQRTLRRLADEKYGSPEKAAACKHGRAPIFSAELEEELVQYCSMMSHFYGLTTEDLRRMALQLAVRNNIKHPFNNTMAGKKWLTLFLRRHPNLSINKSVHTCDAKKERYAKKETNVNKFFDVLDAAFEEYNYPPDRIFNVDATCLTILPTEIPQIIGRKDKRQISMLTPTEKRSSITVICAMSAAGTFVPPMIIFPRKDMTNLLMKGAPPCAIGVANQSGWVQSNLFIQWFKHFINKIKPNQHDPILLLLDGHYSHIKNIELMDLSKEHFVKIISFPSDTTHELQPLDKSFMGPLMSSYAEEVKTWTHTTQKPVTENDVMDLFGRAYIKCQTAEIAISGFKLTGIYPRNRHIYFNTDLTQKEIQEEHSNNPLNEPQTPMFAFETLPTESDTLDRASYSTVSTEPQPSTSRDISPSDTISMDVRWSQRVSTRGRKPSEIHFVKSSTYNKQLIQKIKEKKEQGYINKKEINRRKGQERYSSHCPNSHADRNINNNVLETEGTKKLTLVEHIANNTSEVEISFNDVIPNEQASPCTDTPFYFVDCSLNFHDDETSFVE
ncbi:uncharacterized protein LOC105838982 [Monomorium pharaonis]|uniref:uncharacterized protein LOC105838982 n=1 Tax=Monomorium pharaonis TaxID=307658 RepID=UPI00063FAB87|nr:uncharacterized protein LOC105838982 [Monomorium pharaonis]XP_012540413.1 uncharacterized protein LOC105838982 [Monomorium pharaonis]